MIPVLFAILQLSAAPAPADTVSSRRAALEDGGSAALEYGGSAALEYDGSAALEYDGSAALEYDGSAGQTQIVTPRFLNPDVRVDGRLDESIWDAAPVLTGFTQYDPSEGVPASQPTEVRVFVTHDAIYLAIKAFDSDPDGIRATMTERDEVTRSNDYVRVVLDTFNDQRRAYAFSVNPYGVQQDGIWLEGGSSGGHGGRGGGRGGGGGGGGFRRPPIDDNPDFIWDSGGRLTDQGYEVEMRIPFKSVRFADLPVQSWGIQVTRRIQRNGYQQSWAPSFANQPNKLLEAGQLLELRDLDPGLFMEINPVVTGSLDGALDDNDEFFRDDPNGAFGVNMTYGITSNLTLDGTVNPDFSQVEADAGQIAVNERFALFFPEKRPFFLEGTEIFGLPRQLVFTRTIVDPITGAKLTGKVGGANLGYLGAIDEAGDEGNLYVNLVRLRQDVGSASTVGAIYTDRTRNSGDFNRVTGLDGRFVMARRYTLQVQGAASWDRDDGGATSTGSLFYAQLARAGRGLTFSALFEDLSTGFRPESGFIRRLAEAHAQTQVSYNWYGGRGDFVERWGPSLDVQGYWDHDAFWDGNRWREATARLTMSLSMRNNISVWVTGTRSEFSSPVEDYEGLVTRPGGVTEPFLPDNDLFGGLNSFNVFMYTSGWERLRGRISADFKEEPIFYRNTGAPVDVANRWGGNVSLTLLPTRFLSVEAGVRHSVLNRKQDGSRYSRATIPRIKAQYQFNRALFVRGTVEYSSQELAALRHPETGLPLESCDEDGCDLLEGSANNGILFEALLSYEPSPGTLFFLGYTREMEDARRFGFENVQPTADGLFAKLSYRLRF